jgi:hypothetical protein
VNMSLVADIAWQVPAYKSATLSTPLPGLPCLSGLTAHRSLHCLSNCRVARGSTTATARSPWASPAR